MRVSVCMALIVAVALPVLAYKKKGSIQTIRADKVYSIVERHGFLYFSTSDSGIFRFRPETPHKIETVARSRAPFRALAFIDDTLFALSYKLGLCRVVDQDLIPFKDGIALGWSMKLGDQNEIGLAGTQGAFLIQDGSVRLHIKQRTAHDIVFYDTTFAVAHKKGISFYNRETGTLTEERFTDTNFWTGIRHRDLVVYGGQGCVVIHRGSTWKRIALPDPKDLPWTSALVGETLLYIGSQNGLFVYDLTSGELKPAGFEGECIKALFTDSNEALWVGRFG